MPLNAVDKVVAVVGGHSPLLVVAPAPVKSAHTVAKLATLSMFVSESTGFHPGTVLESSLQYTISSEMMKTIRSMTGLSKLHKLWFQT